jgi:hypothetical protein
MEELELMTEHFYYLGKHLQDIFRNAGLIGPQRPNPILRVRNDIIEHPSSHRSFFEHTEARGRRLPTDDRTNHDDGLVANAKWLFDLLNGALRNRLTSR